MKRLALAGVIIGFLTSPPAFAQTFSSGSTGADGALNLATMTAEDCSTGGAYAPPPGNPAGCWIQLTESGILNYTTINIPAGKTLFFKKNLKNTPVILLAQGDVVIAGTIKVDAQPYGPDGRADSAQPGPGGYPGASLPTSPGLGPGGGTGADPRGRWVGPLSLVPIVGGSGGGSSNSQCSGTGGAGAIVIASDTEIQIVSGGVVTSQPMYGAGCLGSGGAVRLVAKNRIILAGSISTVQPSEWYWGAPSYPGIVRLEAPTISYTGTTSPEPIQSTINPAIAAAAVPDLRIVSVGGFAVPVTAGARKDAADLVLPRQLPDPINVVVEASNIPVGSSVTVSFGTSNQGTATAAVLAGTLASSTATIGVSGLNREQFAFLYVQVMFAPPTSGDAGGDIPESDRVTQVRMTQAPGAKPQFAFLRRDGAEVPADKLPPNLRGWVSNTDLR